MNASLRNLPEGPRPMRLFRPFALLLALLAPVAQAQTAPAAEPAGPVPYHLEVVLFRQGEPIASGQPAPEDWARNVNLRASEVRASTRLDAEVAKLTPENGYEVLMHRAWRQTLGPTASHVAIGEGEPQLGQYPVHGTLRLRLDRLVEMQAELWVNQLNEGQIVQSEQIKQNRRLKPGELTFVDGTSLGLLVRATPE